MNKNKLAKWQKNKSKTLLLNLFEKNKDTWISKYDISELINQPHNICRSWISELRQLGYTIMGNKKLGYKLTTKDDEIINYAENEIRKNTILLKTYKKWIKKVETNNKIKNNYQLDEAKKELGDQNE